jgi:hypothetical protein
MFADDKETRPPILRPTCTIPIMLMIKLIALRSSLSVTVRALTRVVSLCDPTTQTKLGDRV